MINWNDVWKHQMLILNRWVTLQTEFWDKIADYETENGLSASSDLTHRQLELIELDHEDTLLEIGPGCGRLTIPLAKRARSVTVIEPSRRMLTLLMERARAAGLYNINYINKRWEDIEIGRDVSRHDVVLASFSLLVFDLKAALEKVDAAAMKAAYVFLSADCGALNEVREVISRGRAPAFLSDHIIAYNLLHSLGITANVNIIEYEVGERFTTIDEALRRFVETYALPTSSVESLKEHLKKLLVREPDGLWYRRRRKAAAIWWTK